MIRFRFELAFATLLLTLFAAVAWWQTGAAAGKITSAELEAYLAKAQKAPVPPEEKATLLARLRAWGEADDGRPLYMLNLMRFHDELRRWPGAPAFEGTPQQANAYYESQVLPLALHHGAAPITAGEAQGHNVLMIGGKTRRHDVHAATQELDEWGRVLVMRYPSRRAFFDLITDPAYLPNLPYKLMALQVVLVPVSTELFVPDLRWLAGGVLLVAFFAVGWLRAARRR